MIEPDDTESLKAAIEEMHGGKARLVQSGTAPQLVIVIHYESSLER